MRAFLVIIFLIATAVFITKKTEQTAVPSVSPIAALATVPREVEVKNLDGSKKLILVDEKDVYISDEKGRRLFFSGENLSLPPNAWAPDDVYVFLKQNDTFLVFKTSGESFASGEQYLDVVSLFGEKLPDFTIRDATGWDGVGLMHIQSDKYSYWFNVASKSFLQLAR